MSVENGSYVVSTVDELVPPEELRISVGHTESDVVYTSAGGEAVLAGWIRDDVDDVARFLEEFADAVDEDGDFDLLVEVVDLESGLSVATQE